VSLVRDLIDDGRPHLFDGGMGTMLYAGGVFINRCYDELNVTDPRIVEEVHRAYARAGA
jgi:homocysteine S-methyltransferase